MRMYTMDEIEKAIRNIANGRNAKGLIVGQIQARVVKTLMEEGIIPMVLLEKGRVHSLETIRKKEEVKRDNFSHD